MADLKAEQIMAAVLVLMQATTTAGANAVRDRDGPVDVANSLSVEQGADDPLEVQGNAFVDSRLRVTVVACVRKNDAYSTQINLIRKEVHAAMMVDRQLGLPDIVMDTMSRGADQPEPYGEGDETVMKMSINFDVYYRHSLTDASA